MLREWDAETTEPLIDYELLEANLEAYRSAYLAATPWPHVVIDDFLQPEIAARAAAAFPPIGKLRTRLARLLEARSYGGGIDGIDPSIADVFEALHSDRFVAFLEAVTSVAKLDPDRELLGAGVHQGARGSYLRLHADHNTHPNDASRFRRINVMLYLNESWRPEWNGDLELWDREAVACRKRIEPKFNRCAILSVDDTAFHGYGPLRLPSDQRRKALAAYYYTGEAADGQALESHPTTMPEFRGEHPLASISHRLRRSILFRVEKRIRKGP